MRVALRWLCACALLCACAQACALEDLAFSAGPLAGTGWRAESLRVELALRDLNAAQLSVVAEGVAVPALFKGTRTLTFACGKGQATTTRISCNEADLVFTPVIEGLRVLPGGVSVVFADAQLTAGMRLNVAGVPMQLSARANDGGWEADISARAVALKPLVERFFTPSPDEVVIDEGEGQVAVHLRGDSAGVTGSAKFGVTELAFSDTPGETAAEGVEMSGEASFTRKSRKPLRFATQVRLLNGAAYIAPFYHEVKSGPIELALDGSWMPTTNVFDVERISIDAPALARLSSSVLGRLDEGGLALDAVAIEVARTQAGPLLGVFSEGALADLDARGEIALSGAWRADGAHRATLSLYDLDISQEQVDLNLEGISGALDWSNTNNSQVSHLAWRGGRVYGVSFGESTLTGRLEKQGFTLLEPAFLPVLDGGLSITDLTVTGVASANPTWRFSGAIKPISVELLTSALEWPTFGGELSGSVPSVHYADGVVAADGSITVQVFSGEVRVRDLRLLRPLGPVPVFSSNVDIKGLSLAALTDAFSFGNIQGQLDGRVRGLVLQDWQPIAFDGAVFTPPGDRSRRRISQKAVESLSKLGGASGVISSMFLSLLKEFSYRELGLSCTLQNGVCEMGGAGPAEQGFYIVRGGGFPPRIDVLGYNKKVDWNTLLERLKTVTSSEGPVIR